MRAVLSLIVVLALTVQLVAIDFGDRVYKSVDGKQYIRCLYNENMSISVSSVELENAGKHKWRKIKLANGEEIEITIQPGVNNCKTIAFVNTLLAIGEPKDSSVITEALAQPYAVPTGTIFNRYYKDKYKTSIKYFSKHNFDNTALADKDGVFQEMMAGWKAGKAYEIAIGTHNLPTDMKRYEDSNFTVYYTPECDGYNQTFNTGPHAVFVVGFTVNSKGENVIILDRYGDDIYITESYFQYELGKVILSVQCIERPEATVTSPIKKVNQPVTHRLVNAELTNLPLYEAQYVQSFEPQEIGGYVSHGNCANVAYANCCASLVGKQEWINKIAIKHYRFYKEGDNPILGSSSSGSEPEFIAANLKYETGWHESTNLYTQEKLSTFKPEEVWTEMIDGMRNSKRYIINTSYELDKLIGSNPDNAEYAWECPNHAIYVEGFRLIRGEIRMQLDRYGHDFFLNLEEFKRSFLVLDTIATITKL